MKQLIALIRAYYSSTLGALDGVCVLAAAFFGTAFTGSILVGLGFAVGIWLYGLLMIQVGFRRCSEARNQKYRELHLHNPLAHE